MSEFTPDIETVIQATQWLTTSPDTHTGYPHGKQYIVAEMATTDDGSRILPQGVHFGHTESYYQDGRMQSSGSIKLVNHADRTSHQDCIPISFVPEEGEPLLGIDSHEAVNMRQLGLIPDETLARMAANARTILTHYGVEIN